VPDKYDQSQVGIAIELKLVNRIRARLNAWRQLALRGEGGVTRTTMELMNYWRRERRGPRKRLFFAQLEAAETIIFLTEARSDFRQGIEILASAGSCATPGVAGSVHDPSGTPASVVSRNQGMQPQMDTNKHR
jgi:hypothetical protein